MAQMSCMALVCKETYGTSENWASVIVRLGLVARVLNNVLPSSSLRFTAGYVGHIKFLSLNIENYLLLVEFVQLWYRLR